MRFRRISRGYPPSLLAGLLLICASLSAQTEPTASEIVGRNIKAAGGREKLAQVQTLSFRAGSRTYSVGPNGTLKILRGFQPPVVFEVVLVAGDRARRNSMNRVTEITGTEKARLRWNARLYQGAFSLANFSDRLTWRGIKTYGPARYYCLTAVEDGLEAAFYVDVRDDLLKRVVFKSADKAEKSEFVQEFGDHKEAVGLMLPTSLFTTQVGVSGTEGSTSSGISDVAVNRALEPEFFSSLEINVGRTEIAEGDFKGNVIYSGSEDMAVIALLNCTPEVMAGTGFKSGDPVVCLYGQERVPAVFYASQDDASQAGAFARSVAHLAWGEESGGFYYLYFTAPTEADVRRAVEKFTVLMPIEIKRAR